MTMGKVRGQRSNVFIPATFLDAPVTLLSIEPKTTRVRYGQTRQAKVLILSSIALT